MLFIHDDDQRSYRGHCIAALWVAAALGGLLHIGSPRWMASPSSPIFASRPGGARNATRGTSTTGC